MSSKLAQKNNKTTHNADYIRASAEPTVIYKWKDKPEATDEEAQSYRSAAGAEAQP